jgi:serine/threonine-protein kinase HipA
MKSSSAIKLSGLVESARLAVSGSIGADGHASAALTQIIRVGTSAGGARAKAVIAWNPKSNEIRAGQFDVGRGFEHWILKFDGLRANEALGDPQGYGRVEYAYHLMARAAGMTLPAAHLLEENGRAHFMSKRFDRTHNTKHHVQTLCAMGHLDYRQKATHDASQLFQVMNRLGLGYTDREEAFRRIAFEWTSQHLLGVNGKFTGISADDLLQVADRFAIGSAPKVLRQVADAVSAWPDVAQKAQLDIKTIARIRQDHRTLAP